MIHRAVTVLSQDVKAHDCRQRTACCNPTSCLDRSFTDCVRSPGATALKVRTVRIYHSATSIKQSDREIRTRCGVRHHWPVNRQIFFSECGMWRLNEACWISLRSWQAFSWICAWRVKLYLCCKLRAWFDHIYAVCRMKHQLIFCHILKSSWMQWWKKQTIQIFYLSQSSNKTL